METVKITAQDVNKLRQTTGVGMMDCKKALEESNGDFEAAIEILRKKGQKVAANRSDRSANEGFVLGLVTSDKTKGVLVALNCETDFVAQNADFSSFATKVTTIALDKMPATKEDLLNEQIDGRTIHDLITDMVGRIGEKIEIGCYEKVAGDFVYAYNHPGNRIVAVVGLNKKIDASETAAKNVAMQVASMNPVAVDKTDVPSDLIEKEIEIAKDLLRQEGKPEDKIDMIAKGKLEKYFKENTLLNQDFIMDNKLTVSQYLKSLDKDLTVSAFKRYGLGQ